MFRLNRFCSLSKNALKFGRLGSFGDNAPKTIASIGKWFHNYDLKFSDAWTKSLNEQQKQQITFIQNELTLHSLQRQRVPKPEWVSKSEYMEMLTMTTSRRRSFYGHLFGKHWSIVEENNKRIVRAALQLELDETTGSLEEKPSKPNHIQYGLGKNSLFLRFSEHHIAKWKNRNLIRAYYENAPPLVFDCEFVNAMTKIETESAVREIMFSFCALREDKSPFVMHLCNLAEGTYFWDRLQNGFRGFQRQPIIVSSKDITELYPSAMDNLIYLTPDADRVLDKIEPNYGYIIGAIVDKGDKIPHTLAKAKKSNIQAARLPVDGFVKFRAQKALPFDQVTRILLEAKFSNDWKKAFTHIAKRKLM